MDFLITGTRAYGPVTEDSDLDIVVKLCDIKSITNYLLDRNIQMYSTPGQDLYAEEGGFYFDLAGIKVNIIVAATQDEFNEWNARTERMKKLPHIEDREARIHIFRNGMILRSFVKMDKQLKVKEVIR